MEEPTTQKSVLTMPADGTVPGLPDLPDLVKETPEQNPNKVQIWYVHGQLLEATSFKAVFFSFSINMIIINICLPRLLLSGKIFSRDFFLPSMSQLILIFFYL